MDFDVVAQQFTDLKKSPLADAVAVEWAERFGPAIAKFRQQKKKRRALDSAYYVKFAVCKFLAQLSSSF